MSYKWPIHSTCNFSTVRYDRKLFEQIKSQILKHAVLNSGVTETSLEFYGLQRQSATRIINDQDNKI